jgi:hypothetical protein
MMRASYEFEHGYAKPIYRGIVLWNGSEYGISSGNPRRSFDDLVYDMIRAQGDTWCGYSLKGVKVTIEIEEATGD